MRKLAGRPKEGEGPGESGPGFRPIGHDMREQGYKWDDPDLGGKGWVK